jgi:hypothetical protein
MDGHKSLGSAKAQQRRGNLRLPCKFELLMTGQRTFPDQIFLETRIGDLA